MLISKKHTTLGEICDIINGRNQKLVEDVNGAYPIYGSGGVMGRANAFLCKGGSTIIGRKGTINKPLYACENFWNVDTAFGLCPKEGVDNRFFFFLCQNIDWLRYNKSTTLPSLVKSDLLMIPVSVPIYDEQIKISAELDLLTGIIEKKNEQLKILDKLAESIFFEMFGDPVSNEKSWPVNNLGTLCNSELGKMLDSKRAKGTNKPYLCTINVLWDKIDLSTVKEMPFEDEELERYSIKKGDLLICEGGDTGRAAIWDRDDTIYYQNSIHRVRFDEEKMLPQFFLCILKLYKQQGVLNNYSSGQTIKHLVKKSLLSIPVPTPPIEIQNVFAQKLDNIKRNRHIIECSLRDAQQLLASRMDKYFNA